MPKITITVGLFGPVREALGRSMVEVDLPVGSTVGELLEFLRADFENLAPLINVCRVAIGTEYVDSSAELVEGDEAALIPPVAGG